MIEYSKLSINFLKLLHSFVITLFFLQSISQHAKYFHDSVAVRMKLSYLFTAVMGYFLPDVIVRKIISAFFLQVGQAFITVEVPAGLEIFRYFGLVVRQRNPPQPSTSQMRRDRPVRIGRIVMFKLILLQ